MEYALCAIGACTLSSIAILKVPRHCEISRFLFAFIFFHMRPKMESSYATEKIQFASLQSQYAREVMEKFHVPPDLDSIIVIEDEHLYTHSSGTYLLNSTCYVLESTRPLEKKADRSYDDDDGNDDGDGGARCSGAEGDVAAHDAVAAVLFLLLLPGALFHPGLLLPHRGQQSVPSSNHSLPLVIV